MKFYHIENFVFDRPLVDEKGKPLNTYNVILIDADTSLKLQNAHFMSIGFTRKYKKQCLQLHHYDIKIVNLLKKWGYQEGAL